MRLNRSLSEPFATPRRAVLIKGAIVTDYMFGDLEVIKEMRPNRTPGITMLGGTVGNESMTIAGAPDFVIGVRYLVFVAGNGSVIFPVVGGHQGIFQVRPDPQTGGSNVYDYGGRPIIGLPASKEHPLEPRCRIKSLRGRWFGDSDGGFNRSLCACDTSSTGALNRG